MKFLYLIFLLILPTASFAKEETSIEVWTRTPGTYFEGKEVIKGDLKKSVINKSNAIEVKLKDVQVGKVRTFRGMYLKKIVDDQSPPRGGDEVLLHFQNGMIIPIDLQGDHLRRSNPFVAIAYKAESGKWTTSFPEIVRPREDNVKDPRPLEFTSNKVIVTSRWHPQVAKQGEGGFSPWLFVDSLTGIEFVNRKAYEKQFEVSDTPVFASGMKVYRERCQYCHSVRGLGARYGWDYVEPLAVYKQKQPENLFFHVTRQKVNSVERGFMMPSQKDLTEKDSKDLWLWMKDEAEKQQKPYDGSKT